jgi:hypothetical protein
MAEDLRVNPVPSLAFLRVAKLDRLLSAQGNAEFKQAS